MGTAGARESKVEKIGLGVLVEGGGSDDVLGRLLALEAGRRARVEVRVWLVLDS